MFGELRRPAVLVLGLGESGLAMARWCARQGCRLRVADMREVPPNLPTLGELGGDAGAEFIGGGPFTPDLLDGMELIAISPGLAPGSESLAPLLDRARERNVPVWGELELFAQALRALGRGGYAPRVLAVTGTNGKTTTTALTGLLCQRAGKRVAVAGNISPSLLERLMRALDEQALPDVWVLELSSFQLETAYSFAPDAATVLNVTQDHLDWHGSFDAYAAAKARIFGASTVRVLNRDDARSLTLARGAASHVSFGIDAPRASGDYGLHGEGGLLWLAIAQASEAAAPGPRRSKAAPVEIAVKRLMPVDALRIHGLHNASNALAALALASAIGLPLAELLHGLREYRGEPHRVEFVATVNDITYIDDSKGTNVGATVAALDGLARPTVLIAGGEGKAQNFAPLAAPVARWCRAVVLVGRDVPLLRAALEGVNVPLVGSDTLESAVGLATMLAQPGDAVLLSPACASFDMFKNYAHRAEVFKRSVEDIAAELGVML